MKKFTFLFLIALFSFNAMAQQYDFTQNGIYYKITNATNHEVSVVSELAGDPKYNVKPTGIVSIPEIVTNVGVDYTVTAIGEWAFFYCPDITWVKMPKTIASIGTYAFTTSRGIAGFEIAEGGSHYVSEDGVLYNISKTALVAFPPQKTGVWTCPTSITTIGNDALNGAKISDIIFPNGSALSSIGNGAFTMCQNLSSITLPSTLTSIGNQAFYGCKALKTVDIPASVNTIGSHVFYECDSLKAINVDPANMVYSSDAGVLYNKAKTTLMLYPLAKPSTSYTVADSAKTIADYAIFNNSNLKSLSLPAGLTKIGEAGLCYLPNLSSLTCNAVSPASITLGNYVLSGMPVNTCILYVPAGSESAYRAADKWKEFMQILPINSQVGLDIAEKLNINIYPNPAVDFVAITSQESFIGEKLAVFDLKGNEIYNTLIDSQEVKINVQGWTKGVYFVKVGNSFSKFIVK